MKIMKRAGKVFTGVSLTLLLILPMASVAGAAVPTFVTNKQNEAGELIETLLKNDWLKNVVHNLQGLEALASLVDMVSQVQDVMDNFDIQGIIGEATSFLSEDFMSAVQEKLSGINGGGGLLDALKSGIGGGSIDLGGLLKGNLGDLLDKNGPLAVAREATERMRNAGNEAVKSTETGYGTGNRASTSTKLPPFVPADKVFKEEGSGKYSRDGKVYTKPEMENVWKKEGGGASKNKSGQYTWSPAGNTSSPAGQTAAKATGAVSGYMEKVNEYNPMVLPVNQDALSNLAVEMTLGKTQNERSAFLLAMSQEQKNLALEGLASIVAKYTDPEKSYQAAVNTSMEQYKDTLKKAADVSGKTAPGEALKAIAGLLAVQVEQLNTQNILLVNMTDIMVDEIKVLDRLGNLAIENYASSLYNNLKERVSHYEATKQSVRN